MPSPMIYTSLKRYTLCSCISSPTLAPAFLARISQRKGSAQWSFLRDALWCLLQAVSDYEHRHKAMMSKEVVAMREHNHVLAVLPQLFDKVRALFGAAGPSTRNFEQACHAILSPPRASHSCNQHRFACLTLVQHRGQRLQA